jgi:hypothetical protein
MYAELTMTSRPEPIPAREDMPDDLEPALVRQMEVYAGFLDHTDRLTSPLAFYSVLGGVVWATAMVLAGDFFGQSWDASQHWPQRSPLLLVLLLLGAPGAYFAYRWATSHRSR